MGREHTRKEPFQQLTNLLFGTSTIILFILYGIKLTLQEDLLLEGVDRSEVAVAVKTADVAAFLRRVIPAQQRI